MKKYIVSLSLILAFVFYLALRQPGASAPANQPAAVSNVPPVTPSGAVSTPATPAPSAPPKRTTMPGGGMGSANMMQGMRYKDGQYTGTVADAYYGNVQVQATVQSGKIVDVQFLDYPNSHGTSIEINSIAMPYLKSEAIQAQNANVNVVSGATQTSEAFIQSLSAALQQATS